MSKTQNILIKKLKSLDIDKRIIESFASVDRTKFIDPFYQERLDELVPLPIGYGEKTDDPLVLARMISLMDADRKWRILEVGTGSGYSSAVLSNLAREIVSVEYHESLGRAAKTLLVDEGFYNIRFYGGDASEMRSDRMGIFDAVIIHAACIQRPFGILSMLREGGRAVYPMGPPFRQQITLFRNLPMVNPDDSMRHITFHDYCNYDSIRGKYGWVDQPDVLEIPGEEDQSPEK